MKNTITLFLLLAVTTLFPQADKTYLYGTLTDENDRPLEGAHVIIESTVLGTSTNALGKYKIKLQPGQYTVKYSYVGYKIIEKTVQIKPEHNTECSINLFPDPIMFKGVMIETDRYKSMGTSRSFVIEPHLSKNIPALGEPDILHAVNFLPGVINSNDFRGEFHSKGGGTDQNTILLDGVEIYNAYHLYGLAGIFNIDALESAEVFLGNYPAKYDGRVSSVIDIKTALPKEKLAVNVSLLSSSIVYNKPFKSSSLLFAARKTYFDLVTPIHYSFYDINTKYRYQKNAFTITPFVFLNRDKASEDSNNGEKLIWGNTAAGINSTWQHANNRIDFSLANSRSTTRFNSLDNKSNENSIKLDYSGQYKHNRLQLGYKLKDVDFDYFWNEPTTSDLEDFLTESIPNRFEDSFNLKVQGLYANHILTLYHNIEIETGLRSEKYLDNYYQMPRGGVTLNLPMRLRLSLNSGRYYQYYGFGEEARKLSVSNLLFLTDSPVKSDNHSIGLKGYLKQNISFELEVYKRKIENLSRYTDIFPEFEYGDGNISGFNIILNKSEGAFTYQLDYNYLDTEATFGQQTFPLQWEAKHAFHGFTGLQIKKGWFLNLLFTYRSGVLFTPIRGAFGKINPFDNNIDIQYRNAEMFYLEGKTNSERLPAYSRLDVSIRKKMVRTKYSYTVYFQIINLLNRQNHLYYDWDKYYSGYGYDDEGNKTHVGNENSLPIVPSIGVYYEF